MGRTGDGDRHNETPRAPPTHPPQARFDDTRSPDGGDIIMSRQTIKLEEHIALIIKWLWLMPLLSLPELASVTGLAYHRCSRLMKILDQRGLVDHVRLGMILEVQDRWHLSTSGVHFVMRELGWPLEWQVSQGGLRMLMRRLPILEVFYRLAHRIWGHPGVTQILDIYWSPDPDVDPVSFPRDLRLTRFQWQRDPDVHAITEYENGAWVPWIWVGPMTKGNMIPRKMMSGLTGIALRSWTAENPTPAGWVVVGADLLAAGHAASVWTGDEMMVITADGTTLKSMRPQLFTEAYFQNARVEDLGVIESIPDWVEKDPVVSGLNGRLAFSVFRLIAQWPGMRIGQIQEAFTHSHGDTNAALARLVDRGLAVAPDERPYYLTREGMLAAARMDRISHQSVYGSFDAYLKPDGAYRRFRQRHDQAVADVVRALSRQGYGVFHGRRHVVNVTNTTQLAPDMVATWIWPDGRMDLWFVEVELSAKRPSSALRKLRPYREHQRRYGRSVDLMMVLGSDDAEQAFLDKGAGLSLKTTTLDRLLQSGPGDNPWKQP